MDLKTACDVALADPALKPRQEDGRLVTHCNQGARFIAHCMGCSDFDDPSLLADGMYAIMAANASGKWARGNGVQAAQWALAGALAFAAKTAAQLKEAHGHIAAIYPEPPQMSGSLGRMVPICANIGRNVPMLAEKVSAAFPVALGEPDYFLWTGG